MELNLKQPWYHGSPLELFILRPGSTITQKRDLARIFSHKPTIVSVSDNGQIKHNGRIQGYLYCIVDEIRPEDVLPHPQTTMSDGDEWLTTRELHLELICTVDPVSTEQLSEDDYKMLQDKLSRQG
jgi:hypothetical protein